MQRDPTAESIVPRHVAIIMDGNGRWAERQGNPRTYGHENGRLPVRESIRAAIRHGVEYLTLYAFSTENWRRPEEEVSALMGLLMDSILEYLDELCEQGVCLRTIGDLRVLPEDLQLELARAKRATEQGERLTLIVALNYGARQEIAGAAQRLVSAVQRGKVKLEEIDDGVFGRFLETAGVPDPELLIRTGGEMRLSNFLLWQLAYGEFLFIKKFWPDFREADFDAALREYAGRQRRFGGVV